MVVEHGSADISFSRDRVPFFTFIALLVVILTLVGVAVGHYPGLRMNRATIALSGATVLGVMGAISLEQAYAALRM